MPPDVAVTPATSGVGEAYFQRSFPVEASNAVSQPFAFSRGSEATPQCMPCMIGGSLGAFLKVPHQSTAGANKVLLSAS
jgi:hypothetical protein